jgi:3',5'-cyclic-nucleotide phosphodiesterase
MASPSPVTEQPRTGAPVRIEHVFLTHQLLDPAEALPLIVDSVGARCASPLVPQPSPETIAVLRANS